MLSGDLQQNDTSSTTGSTIVGTNAYHVVTAVRVSASTLLDGFYITAGNARDNGGGMYNSDYSNPTLTNVYFSSNKATERGGGMYNDYSNPTLTNVSFSGNSAIDGGGMYNSYYSNPTLNTVFFTGNKATGSGGGMYNDSSSLTLNNVTFNSNVAKNGGGIFNNDSDLTLDNVTFSSNKATGSGGGMYNDLSTLTLTNVTFSSNTATDSGGGIYNSHLSILTLTTVNFSGNSATAGGGMYSQGCPYVFNATFTNNKANNGDGGGIVSSGCILVLNNVTFSGNTATGNGGGIFIDGGTSTLTNITVIGNTSNNRGGGIFNSAVTLHLTNAIIRDNTATRDGGGMFNEFGYLFLANVTIIRNTAGSSVGGIYTRGNAAVASFRNVLIDGNSAKTYTSLQQSYSETSIKDAPYRISPNDTSAAQVKRDADGKITDPTGLQIGTTCPYADIVGVKRNDPCTVGAYEFTGKLAGSTTTAALSAATLASQSLTWNTAAGTVTLDLPSGAIAQPTWLFYDPTSATVPALVNLSLSAASDGTFQSLPDFAFAIPVTLTIPYTATEALELRRFDATAGVWTTTGITTAGQTATTRSFALTRVGQYGLFPVPTSVWLEARASSPAGLQAIPGGTLLTYQLTLHNAGQAPASGVVVSDTLPLGVTFANWVNQDTAALDGTRINWQPADIAVGGSASISFTVNSSNAAPYLGQSIVNTVAYTLGDTSDTAQVAFSLNGPPTVTVISMTTPISTPLTIVPFLLGISNPDGSPLTMSIGTPQHGTATLVGSTIIYTPTADFMGNDTFSYTVQDGTFSVSSTVEVRVATLAFPFVGQSVDARTIMPGQTLTYQITIGNGQEAAVQQGIITTTLPISLTFGQWLTQDNATLTGNTITWGPSDLGLNTSKTISFTVVVDPAAAGTRITNTAQFTARNADPASDTLTLHVIAPRRTYLPLIMR